MIIRKINEFRNLIVEAASLSTNYFSFNKQTNTFTTEISDLPRSLNYRAGEKTIVLINPKTGNHVTFIWYKTDMDGSNEDTYGWRYQSVDGKLFVLIIND